MTHLVGSFLSAFVFGLGLAISGMIDPAKVQNFLDVAGRWDPSLAFVMGAALLVTAIGFAGLRSRGYGLRGVRLQWPTRRDIDFKLLTGAVLFGIGWGLAGYCPGPALGSLAFGRQEVLTFVASMIVALFATQKVFGGRK